MKIVTSAVLAFAVCAAAETIRMERAAWEKYQPLGGEFDGHGGYSTAHELAPAFEVARVEPAGDIVVEATFTPERKAGGGYGNAAIAVLESPGRYWHVFLGENAAGKRSFGFTELNGLAQAQGYLPLLASNGDNSTWEWGRAYRLRISLGGGAAEGEVRDAATGETLYRRRYGLAPGHVAAGRPGFKFYRLLGRFEAFDSSQQSATGADGTQQPATGIDGSETASGFFSVERDDAGKWWFLDPAGQKFFLCGVNSANHNGNYSAALGYAPYGRTVARKYPDVEAWAANTLSRLRSWGFNFLSSPSPVLLRREFPHAQVLAVGQDFSCYGDEFDLLPCDGGPCSGFPNVFHPLWPDYCRFKAELCARDRDDSWTFGWYIDNELSWWGDKRRFKTPPDRGLFDAAARKSPGHSARDALDAFLAGRGFSSPSDADPATRREFVRLCARKYFEEATKAIREVDPNHLVLGCRFAGISSADPVVWEECGRFCDVASVNVYPMVDLDRGVALTGLGRGDRHISDVLGERARAAGRPVIVTEWSFSALDSGLPCTHGAGQRFFTQKERAEAVSIFARTMWSMPECAGYVYFMWSDQPAVGKNGPSSENTNYGLVNADDEPWSEVVAAISAVQTNPEESRAAALPQERPVIPPHAEEALWTLAEAAELGEVPPFPPASQPIVAKEECPGLQVLGRGALAVLLREYTRGGVDWSSAAKVLRVDAGEDGGEILATLGGAAADGTSFEADIRLRPVPGRSLVVAELLAVRNAGNKPLPFDGVYFRLLPADPEDRASAQAARGDDAFAPPAEGQPTPIPPQLWRPLQSGAWILQDGTALGALAPRATGFTIRFWRDTAPHADVALSGPRRTLAQGQVWTPDTPPFTVLAAVSGGETGWCALCAAARTAFSK